MKNENEALDGDKDLEARQEHVFKFYKLFFVLGEAIPGFIIG